MRLKLIGGHRPPSHHWKLLTPDRRRRAVAALQEQFGVSERRACKVVGQPGPPSACLHHSDRRRARPAGLPARLLPPASPLGLEEGGHCGQEGRLGGQQQADPPPLAPEGLRVPYRKRKRPLRGIGVAVGAMCPIRPNVIWALDFQFDQTSDGRMLKLLNVIDEYTRECLAIDVERSIDADGVVSCLERLAAERGAPAYVRFDHGPEFIAYAVADWCRFNGTDTVFIDPGRRGRTPGSNRSTAACATSTSTASSSTPSSRPRCSQTTGESTTTCTGPTAHTAGSPRSSSSKPGSTNSSYTRIAGGSTIGVRSQCRLTGEEGNRSTWLPKTYRNKTWRQPGALLAQQ